MQFKAKAFAGALALFVAVALPASAQEQDFSAILTGEQETPPVETPHSGTGEFHLNAAQDSLHFIVNWTGLTGGFAGAHFHVAPPGVPGPVVFSLEPFLGEDTLSAEGVWPIDSANLAELFAGNIYVNVHSDTFPAGELRGQLLLESDTTEADSIFFSVNDIGQSQCLILSEDTTRPAVVCVGPVTMEQFPIITIRPGCGDDTPCLVDTSEGEFQDCFPATYFREFGYVWSYQNGAYYRTFVGDGCVCITLEGILPVEFGRLTAEARNGEVALHWNTRSESGVSHFEITRYVSGRPEAALIGTVQATNLPSGASYEFIDRNATPGRTYRYVLAGVDFDGSRAELATVEASPRPMDGSGEVTDYALYDNYPNPFNPETQIRFDLVEAGDVKLTVFDVLGREVATVVDANMASGQHANTFSGEGLATGLYVYRIEVNGFAAQKKMLLVK